ncbi:NAD(P)-dependent oxidoreductase [Brevibacillus sp. SAFN-007a]|uniref:NAD(P)-dependent oxidoreductase n=1 Tax=Brevibacillus sp. SAFN-007a TaxID=3436862 RepID=UPI003F7DF261
MNILVIPSASQIEEVSTFESKEKLEKLGNVKWNNDCFEWDEEKIISEIRDVEVLITSWKSSYISERIIRCAPKLKFIGHAGGSIKKQVHSSAIDKGIKVVSGTTVIANSVAEYALGMMICGLRNINNYIESVKNGGWRWEVNRGWEPSLFNKVVGLIGFGEVAKKLRKLLKPFNCDVVIYDPYLTDEEANDNDVRKVPLNELLSSSDIISLHCGLNEQSNNLLNKNRITLLKENAIIINTANGHLLDERELVKVSKEKNIKVVLDVFKKEPMDPNDELRKINGFYCTPHIAGGTLDERRSLLGYIVDNLDMFINLKKDVGVSRDEWSRLA